MLSITSTMKINDFHILHVLVSVIFLLCMKTSSLGSESLSKDGKMMRCIEREREALLVFKQGVDILGDHDLLQSWRKQEDCCKWKGVGCDNHTGHVTQLHLSSLIAPSYVNSTNVSIGHSLLDLQYLNYLDLSSNFLAGLTIPEFIGSLTKLVYLDLSATYVGRSSLDQIRNLSNLQHLNLSFNNFDAPIPEFIGSLNSLRYLDLSHSVFSGVIPRELGNLFKLQHLDLAYNMFDQIGDENLEWLFNLSSLTHLDLSIINITPPNLWVSLIQRIPSISILRLEQCNLMTPFSTLGDFPSSVSALVLSGNYINSSIFSWLSHLNGSLVELDLDNNVLEGRIPDSIGHMTALTRLNLGYNLLTGPIPDSFAQLTALTHLDLSSNQLNGVLSKSIRNLSRLQVAYFNSNNFTGNLEDLLSGPLAVLQEFSMYENHLTGSLPDFSQLSSLKTLQVGSNQLNGYLPSVFEYHSALQFLDLSNNHLRGSLPDFTGFSSLRVLSLDSNEFSGSLPDFTGCLSLKVLLLKENQLTEWETQSTGLLSNLEELDLSMNSINSTITESHLSNLSSLTYIRTSFNSLTFVFSSEWLPPFQLRELSLASCKLGPKFPNWIRNQKNIDRLDISNCQIADTIPTWFWNLTSVMTILNLSSNRLRGKISGRYVNIQEIDLSSNYFDGPLPSITSKSSKLNLSRNKFSGTLLPLSAVEDLSISFLDISHNQLFGALPDNWMHFQGLVFLNLGYNNFSGRIATSIGHLVSLQTLILRNNKLYGELPASLRNCSRLGFVDFGLNELSGTIPPWIGEDLPELYAVILKSNKFHGRIPYHICHLPNLYFLDLSINKISGTIPPCFDNLTAMIQKGTQDSEHIYYTRVPVPMSSPEAQSHSFFDNVLARWKGQELDYGINFAYLKMIDLSSNELSGEIPIGITKLLEIKGLNLSRNNFYGNVPNEIGQLKVLESLDLSMNNFSGEIPQSMTGLNFLAYLNLSNNNFSGKIPLGTQLQGFNMSAYEGNTRLCGKPLTNICIGEEQADEVWPSSKVDGDDGEYERWLYISVALGFSTTFWAIIGTLVLNRRWRHAYFLFLDNLKQRIFVL